MTNVNGAADGPSGAGGEPNSSITQDPDAASDVDVDNGAPEKSTFLAGLAAGSLAVATIAVAVAVFVTVRVKVGRVWPSGSNPDANV